MGSLFLINIVDDDGHKKFRHEAGDHFSKKNRNVNCKCMSFQAEAAPSRGSCFQYVDVADLVAKHILGSIEGSIFMGIPKMSNFHDAGTSSFGMSGVNAHLLISAPNVPAQTANARPLPLTKARYWAGAFQHILINPSRQQQPRQYRWAVAWNQAITCIAACMRRLSRTELDRRCSQSHDSMTQRACIVEARIDYTLGHTL